MHEINSIRHHVQPYVSLIAKLYRPTVASIGNLFYIHVVHYMQCEPLLYHYRIDIMTYQQIEQWK